MPLLPLLAGVRSLFGNALTFFSRPPGSYLAVLAACVIALWWYGRHEFNLGAASVVQKQQVQAVRLVEHQANITFKISMQFEAAKVADQAATDKLLDEVEVHVTPAIDISHPVPCGFVRVFNAAAHQPIPDTACQPDDAASGISLSEVARTNVENAGLYDQLSHQLTALQDWVKQQKGSIE